MGIEDDIMSEMTQGRSNLQDLGLNEWEDPVKRIAMIIENATSKHNVENAISYDPVQTAYLQKFAKQEILEKRLRTIKKDYFKAVVYADFFTSFIQNDNQILDTMRSRVQDLESIDEFLDPDLGLLVRVASLDYMAKYTPLISRDRRKSAFTRANEEEQVSYSYMRRVNPIYEAAASLFYNQFSKEKIKEHLMYASGNMQLEALLFIDINLSLYGEQVNEKAYDRAERDINAVLESGDYLQAAHDSMEKIAKNVTREPLSRYIATMEPTKY
ncbi:hypothetical protein H6503_05040 [Candidatus Woesearchaeota archaeon]|nr:hypothetical protein [Candidatus Woesearchaeota archaeon]